MRIIAKFFRGVPLFAARQVKFAACMTPANPRHIGTCSGSISPLWTQKRHSTTISPPPWLVNITSLNVQKELLQVRTPQLLLFHAKTNPKIQPYTKSIMSTVEEHNRIVGNTSSLDDSPLVPSKGIVRLALVDCELEQDLMMQFRVGPGMFPMLMFLYNGQAVDRIVGIHAEPQMQQAVRAFLSFCDEAAQKLPNATGANRPTRQHDEDEENASTLLTAGVRALMDDQDVRARKLFTKGCELAEGAVADLQQKFQLDKKKLTPEVEKRMRQDPNYQSLPHLLMGLAILDLRCGNLESAYEQTDEVKRRFPSAAKEQPQVAALMAHVDLKRLTGYDEKKDDPARLASIVKNSSDPKSFYDANLRIAAMHFSSKRYDMAFDTLLRLVRAEPKMMKELIHLGVVKVPEPNEKTPKESTPESRVRGMDATPARKCLNVMFNSLGSSDPNVTAARRKLSVFLHM